MPTRIKGGDTSAVDIGNSRALERVSRTAPASSATGSAPGTTGESVNITDTARRLAALQETIAGMPDIDADRLMQLERDLADATQRRKS